MWKFKTSNKRSALVMVIVIIVVGIALIFRLSFLMIFNSKHYNESAKEVHERERPIKAERGQIFDRKGKSLAGNKPVCTVSVIHSQIKEPEKIIKEISNILGISEDLVKKRVDKVSSIEKIKSNVPKEKADEIRKCNLAGVMVDEDYKRYYPYDDLASKVIGFTGSDNQGIIGLETTYDNYLKGQEGKILTLTTANGVEIKNAAEGRILPIAGNDLYTSIDVNIQEYAEQAAAKVMEKKEAKSVRLIVMNPQNGEIYAMVNLPEFNLNDPYKLNTNEMNAITEKEKNKRLNEMWRNACISDTYEPGSTFKIVTATAALEERVVKLTDTFNCKGFKTVEDRRIRCHNTRGHGHETFVDGIKNSCNPVFIEVGARVGTNNMYKNFKKLGLFKKTGIDLPGEASSIMHKMSNVKAVELATMSFGQSFQITPLELLSAASTIVNGGHTITPHIGVEIKSVDGRLVKTIKYKNKDNVIRKETSDTMKDLLEKVVAEGSGKKAYIEGFRIGGKTATSEKLPRSSKKYISSFIGFAPANDPKVIALVLIDEPTGIYYGGTIAAPVIAEVFANTIPYL